jgi:hypothetical protein
MAISIALKLRAGFNHFLIKLRRTNERRAWAANSTTSQPRFLSQLCSSLEMPWSEIVQTSTTSYCAIAGPYTDAHDSFSDWSCSYQKRGNRTFYETFPSRCQAWTVFDLPSTDGSFG